MKNVKLSPCRSSAVVEVGTDRADVSMTAVTKLVY